MQPIHQDSLSAWRDLRERGGLELGGRDEDLGESLKNRLDPASSSLEAALSRVSTDEFVRAFFDVLQPFAEMFRAILRFFEAARIVEGRAQWNIMVDDVDLSLDHFRRFLEKWDAVPGEIEVPAVDRDGVWAACSVLSRALEMHDATDVNYLDTQYWSGIADVDAWLRAYRSSRGIYNDWPPSLDPSCFGAGLSDLAALGMVSLQTIRRYGTRESLLEEHRARGYAIDEDDGLSPRTIAQGETDYWLGGIVPQLARARTLPEPARAELGQQLQEALGSYPRRNFRAKLSLTSLQSYLSFPIWQKRYELYAVWIATEIVNALPDHDVEIHHEDGRIVFAFHETLVATVRSTWPPVRLISERRVPLASPVGKDRSGNVQPDYGLWRHEHGKQTCGIVVEVKHYKRSASSRFAEVLTDYSRAFPKADVYLVSHGPIGDVWSGIPRELSSRCHAIKNLTVSHLAARKELREGVRRYVGSPAAWHGAKADDANSLATRGTEVLAVDVSGSMSAALQSPDFLSIVDGVIDSRCESAALIDVKVCSVVPLRRLWDELVSIEGSGTNLSEPVEELLAIFDRVVVITDEEGLASLQWLPRQAVLARRAHLIAVEILR